MHERVISHAHFSNDDLLAALSAAARDEITSLARIIELLIEVDERRLHLELACPSLFEFCLQRLRMSEGEAYRRITAARLAKRFPRVLEAIRTMRVTLSNVVLLKKHFTEENVDALLEEAAGKTTRRVEELIARIAPQKDVPSAIRQLPTTAPSLALPLPPAHPPTVNPPAITAQVTTPFPASPALPLSPPAHLPLPLPLPLPPPRPPLRTELVREQLTPLSESRHRVQFTASTALRKKIERAQSLMRHRNVDGDLAVVVERAMDLLIAELEKQKLAATKRPKEAPAPSTPMTPATPVTPVTPVTPAPARAARVSASARREVMRRDGEQCSFVSATGERCPARDFLEIDHRRPRGRRGGSEPSNLRLLCRAHNHYAAEQAFGRDYVARAIAARRRQKRDASPEQGTLPPLREDPPAG